MNDFLFGTYKLNRVIRPMLRSMPKLFLSLFPEMVQSDTGLILYDTTKTKRPGVTPFVHPMARGKVVENQGYSTNAIKPAYLKDIRVHTAHQALKRLAGEALGGSMTQAQRMMAAVAMDMQDQMDMLENRLEVMAAEAVIYGTQTVKGEGFNDRVDFRRSAASKTVLAGTAAWSHPDITIDAMFGQMEDIAEDMRNRIGMTPGFFLFDPEAWKLMRAKLLASDKGGAKYLDKQNRGYDRINVDLTPSMAGEMGLQAKGSFGDIPIFTYQSEYVDPETGTLTRVMPANTVLMIAKSRLEGVRHYGAIQSMDPKTQEFVLSPMEYFYSSWAENEPPARFLRLESAPLMVPYYPDAVQTVTVA